MKTSLIFVMILIYGCSPREVTAGLWEHVAVESCVSGLLT